MLDDFQDSGAFLDELEDELDSEISEPKKAKRARRGISMPSGGGSEKMIFGMTAPQRLVISMMIFLTVCVLGSLCLLVTGKIGF